ncbi:MULTISPECIES: hypothetical protein [Bacillus cereus group]|uniref:hypothetical protein n=1 Tax=Bacillus cereus group TaxID=86661 RepID=UPI000BF3F6D2|nr:MULTISPECIES: hypothetical protein [Bacillus cereus group]PES30635.1 hypothetical protein CN496_08475 [Bacillus cereus]
MKKKLLVTTAALSLSLTSVAPVTSLAATITQNGTQKICDETHTGEFWVDAVRRGAQSVTNVKGKENVEQIMNKLNNTPPLGFLKGSEVKIKIDPTHKLMDEKTEQDTEQGKKEFKYDTMTDITMDDIWLDRDHSDPSLDISYDSSRQEVTIKKIKNIDSTGNLSLATRSCYSLKAYYYDFIFWFKWGEVSGPAVINRIEKTYHKFEKAPKLEVNPYSNVPTIVPTDIDKLNPADYYDVLSHAGEVKAEFVERPDPTKIGEQTATIRVWDEYGEETPSDSEHNITKNVKFNVADKDTWETENLRGWNFYATDKWERVQDSNNSLNGYAIHSTKGLTAKKQYHLEKGATYRFTTHVKPEASNEAHFVMLSLQPNENNPKEIAFFSSNVHQLPSGDKGFKQVSGEFTVEDEQEDPILCFKSLTDKSIYIDSFQLERIK